MRKFRTKLSAPKLEIPRSKTLAQYDYDRKHTCERFSDNAVTAKIGGGAATGPAGDENVLLTAENAFEYTTIGTQKNISPSK